MISAWATHGPNRRRRPGRVGAATAVAPTSSPAPAEPTVLDRVRSALAGSTPGVWWAGSWSSAGSAGSQPCGSPSPGSCPRTSSLRSWPGATPRPTGSSRSTRTPCADPSPAPTASTSTRRPTPRTGSSTVPPTAAGHRRLLGRLTGGRPAGARPQRPLLGHPRRRGREPAGSRGPGGRRERLLRRPAVGARDPGRCVAADAEHPGRHPRAASEARYPVVLVLGDRRTALGGGADLRRRRAAPPELRAGGHRAPARCRRSVERAGRVRHRLRLVHRGRGRTPARSHRRRRSGSSAADRTGHPGFPGCRPPA